MKVSIAQCKKYYHTYEWKNISKYIKFKYGYLCQECLKKGIITKAKDVHHIKPLHLYFELRNIETNLIPVCDLCHRKLDNKLNNSIALFMKELSPPMLNGNL